MLAQNSLQSNITSICPHANLYFQLFLIIKGVSATTLHPTVPSLPLHIHFHSLYIWSSRRRDLLILICPTRINEIEYPNSHDHQHAIEDDEVDFMTNEVTSPPLEHLDGTVDTSRDNHGDRKRRGGEKEFNFPGCDCADVGFHRSHDDPDEEHGEDGNRAHLEHDARNHNVRSQGGVSRRILAIGN